MSTVDEALQSGKPPLGATLDAGVDWLSGAQEMTFGLYRLHVLPLDAFVFWIRDNTVAPKVVKGSIHFSTDTDQVEDETAASNRVIFTARAPVDDLNAVAPGTMWIGEHEGLKIGFSSRGKYFRQADLHHYSGAALMPALRSQIIDDGSTLDPGKLIVSNVLPAFLALNTYAPPYETPLKIGGLVTLYPSYILPENISPPYASVHVERTDPLQGAPSYTTRLKPNLLCADDVRITTYGLDNPEATLLRDTILQYSEDWGIFGIMDFSAIRDEKRPQPEFAIVAQKKTMTFRVSYNQTAVRDHARQLIEQVRVTYSAQEVG